MDVQQIIFVLSEFKFGKLESKSLKNTRKNPEKLSLINHNLDHHYDPDDDS